MSLIKKIQNYASQYKLWERNSKLIVAVSGGPDSACLLDILANLKLKYNLDLHIAHVNYHLRGKDSERDEKFVSCLAKKYNIPISVLQPARFNTKKNLEETLRKIRYDFFDSLRKKLKFDYIAVGHNQDDQAETVLMRIMRGTGLQGLRAMRFKNKKIIRPLLGISRQEIIAYLKKQKLSYRADITNKDVKIARNKIRQVLIPYLEKKFNAAIKKILATASLAIADDYDYIAQRALYLLRRNTYYAKEGELIFSNNKFQKLHSALQREFLRQVIDRVKSGREDIESAHIEEIKKALASHKSKTQAVLLKGLKFVRKGDRVTVFKS